MSECTHNDLRKAREARKLTRWQLGNLLGVSESTVERWERGEVLPTPDDVDRIGDAVCDGTLWHRWMLSNVESYRKRYSETRDLALPVAVMSVGHMLEDIQTLQHHVERDAVDGRIDDQKSATDYKNALQDMIARCTEALTKL